MVITMTQEERQLRRKKDTKNAAIVLLIFFCGIILLVVGATSVLKSLLPQNTGSGQVAEDTQTTETELATETETETETTTEALPVVDEALENAKVFVEGMTLEQKVAQMFMITPESLTGYTKVTAAGDTTKEFYMEYPVGGMIYTGNNLVDAEQTKEMLANTTAFSKEATGLPIFLAVEEEGGTKAPVASNASFGAADAGDMSVIGESGEAQNAYYVGTSIGEYLAALGFNMNFAPVADVFSNTENETLKYRSFSSDTAVVKNMVVAELQGLEEKHIQGVVKTFPGYGAVSGSSSEGLVKSERTLEELMTEELVPFQGAIEYGADFVMVGHIAVPAIAGAEVPSSLSAEMITNLLRSQLGYQGVVITEAMNQKAITDTYSSSEAAVQAIAAGADVILMPADFKEAYTGVLEAVGNGTLSEERINESVARIVKMKQQMQ